MPTRPQGDGLTDRDRVLQAVLRVFVVAVAISAAATTVAVVASLRQAGVPTGRLAVLTAAWIVLELGIGCGGALWLRRARRRRLGRAARAAAGPGAGAAGGPGA